MYNENERSEKKIVDQKRLRKDSLSIKYTKKTITFMLVCKYQLAY